MKKLIKDKVKGVLQLPFYIIILFLTYSNILFIVSLPILLILFIRDWFVYRSTKKAIGKVYSICKRYLGYIIYITGEIGAGKTTLMMGLCQIFQLVILDQIEEAKDKCKKIVYRFDYVWLNDFIKDRHKKDIRYEKIYEEFLETEEFSEYKGLVYDDGINEHSLDELFKEYIRAYYRYLDNNFVMSNIECKSRITGTKNKVFKRDFLKIKKNACPIEHYNVNLLDEVTLDENNTLTSEIVSEDNGQSQSMRVARHLWEATCYFLFTAQNMTRDILMYRELANSEVYVYDRKIIKNYKSLSLIYAVRAKLLYWEKKMFKLLFVNNEYVFENRYNRFKKREFKLMRKIDKINSKAFLKYSVLIKLKGKKDVIETTLSLPINYCYGVADTHYFKFILEYLKLEQKLSYYDVKLSEELSWEEKVKMAKEILASKKKEKPAGITRAEKSRLNKQKHAEEQQRREAARREAKANAEDPNNKKSVEESTDNANLSSNENGEV